MKFGKIFAAALAATIIFGIQGVNAADTLKIGAIGPFTGPAANSGISMQKSWEYAVSKVNAAGGVMIDGKKKQIELLFEDCQSKPDIGVSAAQKLLTRDNVDILVGDLLHSSVTLAIQELAPSFNNKIFYSGQPVSMKIAERIRKEPKKYNNFWKFGYNSNAYGSTIHGTLQFLVSSGAIKAANKTIAFISEDTDYSKSNIEAALPLLKSDGWRVVADEAVSIGHADFYPQLSKIKGLKPDFIVSIFTAANSGVALNVQMKEQALNTPHMGVYYPTLKEFKDGAGDAANGLMFTPLLLNTGSNSVHIAFKKEMEANGMAADLNYGLGVCNASVMMDALKRAGSASVAKLGKALSETDFNCAVGRWVFDQASHSPKVGEDYFILPAAQIQGSKRLVIWPENAASGKYQN